MFLKFNVISYLIFIIYSVIWNLISNGNWTEWSTIQGVIIQVISELDEHEARGQFEIMSTITAWPSG